MGPRAPSGIITPNFVKISQSDAELLQFFDFSRWRPLPSWIFKILNFYCQLQSGGSSCIIVPNFVKIGQTVIEISRFFSSWWQPPSWISEILKFY